MCQDKVTELCADGQREFLKVILESGAGGAGREMNSDQKGEKLLVRRPGGDSSQRGGR